MLVRVFDNQDGSASQSNRSDQRAQIRLIFGCENRLFSAIAIALQQSFENGINVAGYFHLNLQDRNRHAWVSNGNPVAPHFGKLRAYL
jgi:hypothetical protein